MLQLIRDIKNIIVDDPVAEAIRKADVDLSLTPDIWRLQQFEDQLLFVPCDLKFKGLNNKMLKEVSFEEQPVYPQCYTNSRFTFWKKDLGVHSYPIVLPENYRPTGYVRWEVEPARIQGELWRIHPNGFISLDKHRQNTIQFRRERVRIACPWRDVYFQTHRPIPHISPDYYIAVTAWMYLGIQDYWDAQIGGIFASSQVEPVEHYPTPWIDKFYRFDSPSPIRSR